ncbi:MAG: nucleoside triphosphate pyrophosphatase [Pseudomonadota bacterium]
MNIILASSSKYRAELLQRLNITFSTHAPDIDETLQKNEQPISYCLRLAEEKAQAVINRLDSEQNALVIASDQACFIQNQYIEKPFDLETSAQQLRQASGKKVSFYTSLHIVNKQSGKNYSNYNQVDVKFRLLTEKQIQFYVNQEKPIGCAGGFKVEGFGISLFEEVISTDPTALIGLPLIQVVRGLQMLGIDILTPQDTW